MTFFGHVRLLLKRAFKDFDLARDMVYGAILAAITLTLQVWWKLIPVKDWQEHQWQWIGSFVLPFLIVLSAHVAWRLISAPWRVHQDQESAFAEAKTSLEAKSGNLQRELNEEIEKRGRPEIVLFCDWKSEKSPITDRQNPLVIQELNGVTAKDVQIQPIGMSKGTAFYETVSIVQAHANVPSLCRIERNKNTSIAMWDLRVLMKESFGGCAEIKFPIVVIYKDMHGTTWESINELRYNTFLAIGQVHHIDTKKKAQAAS